MNSSKEEAIKFIPIFFAKTQLWSFVYYITVTTFAIFTNSLLIFAMLKDPLKCFPNATSIFVFHLAFSDLLISVMFMEESLMWLTNYGGIDGLPWPFRILNYLAFEVCFFSNMPSIFSLALERCLGIVFPLWHKVNITANVCYTWIAMIWVLGGVVVTIRFTFLIYFLQEQMYVYIAKCTWGILITATLICYLVGVITVRKRRLAVKKNTAISKVAQELAQVRLRNENRFLFTMFIIFVGFFVGVIPSMTTFWLLDVVWMTNNAVALMCNITDMILLLNFAANTCIYLWRLPKYRKTFQVLYCNKSRGDARHVVARHAQNQEAVEVV